MPTYSYAIILSAAKKPAIGVVILEVLWYLFEKIEFLSFLAGDFLFIIKFGLLFWAGWLVLKLGGVLMDAALAGAFTGLVVEVVDFILYSIFYPGTSGGLFYWIKDFIIWIIIAAVIGIIGFFVAQARQSKQNSY